VSTDPGPVPGRNLFVGRTDEVAALNAAAADPAIRIISVHGARGAGKTTLASQLFYYHRDTAGVFDTTSYLSALGKTEEVLLDELYHTIGASSQRSYTPSELPGLLQAEIDAQPTDRLTFIDNVEADVIAGPLFGQCLQMVTRTKNRCVLLLTSRDPLPDAAVGDSGSRRGVRLEGIRETGAILSILGDALRYRHSTQDLVRMADTIGRLPQRLLYCRWAQPSDIATFAQRFAEQQQPLSMEALRQVLSRLSDPLPLLACGVLRGTDIDERLLAWLAQSLGTHSDAGREILLAEMLGHRLVAPVAGTTDGIRIHPDTHVDLMRLCEERGKPWVRACHRAAWEYYRARCADNPDDLSAVGELVHHGLALGEFDQAYRSLFGDGRVERWRQQALSIRVEPILQELRNVSRLNSVVATQERRAAISVALAHVSSDLGRPTICLEHLTAALQDLDGVPRTDAVNQTLRRLWTQMAISHANLGDTARCIEYYRRVINSDGLVLDVQTALCMGYLGYEYCDFENFELANRWTQKALDSCSFERSPQVFSKNLSNRGLVLYFEGQIPTAAACLRQAVDLVGSPTSPAYDIREHGRSMSHYAMVELAQGSPADAVKDLLERSLALTVQAGDARRTALTEGRMGIVAGKVGEFDRSEQLLRRAIMSHSSVGDLRNMIFELLALLSIRHCRWYGTFGETIGDLERAARNIDRQLAGLIGSSISSPDKRYLVDFWLHRQHPRLFANTKARR
jgi:tetratricopeptide (TPR) repeat protein